MTGALYLLAILGGCAAMIALDRRFALYLWQAPRRALPVQLIGVAAFLVWDVVCIHLGIFHRGQGPFTLGIELLPHLPLEEPFFLWFLCHFTMVVFTGLGRLREARRG